MSATPEHDKLGAVAPKQRVVNDFLDFAQGKVGTLEAYISLRDPKILGPHFDKQKLSDVEKVTHKVVIDEFTDWLESKKHVLKAIQDHGPGSEVARRFVLTDWLGINIERINEEKKAINQRYLKRNKKKMQMEVADKIGGVEVKEL